MSNHPAFPLRIGLALAAVLLLLGIPALSWASCASEWVNSAANDTCENESFTQSGSISNIQCKITATCRVSNSPVQDRIDTITVAESDVADLHNCSGYLQVGACS